MRPVLVFFHLLGAFVLVAGVSLAWVAFEVARHRTEPAAIASLLALARIGAAMVAIGLVVAGTFGLALAATGRFGFGVPWIEAATGLLVAVAVLGALGGQRPKRARLHAEALAERREPADDALHRLLDDPLGRGLNYASVALMVAVVALMVFKPGAPGH